MRRISRFCRPIVAPMSAYLDSHRGRIVSATGKTTEKSWRSVVIVCAIAKRFVRESTGGQGRACGLCLRVCARASRSSRVDGSIYKRRPRLQSME